MDNSNPQTPNPANQPLESSQLPAQDPAQMAPPLAPDFSGVQLSQAPIPDPQNGAQPADASLVPGSQNNDNVSAQPQNDAQAFPTVDVTQTTRVKAAKVIEDEDLIEKVWVDKAKKIVNANRDDPYKQNQALTEFKAEYMQKQYNKSIKIDK